MRTSPQGPELAPTERVQGPVAARWDVPHTGDECADILGVGLVAEQAEASGLGSGRHLLGRMKRVAHGTLEDGPATLRRYVFNPFLSDVPILSGTVPSASNWDCSCQARTGNFSTAGQRGLDFLSIGDGFCEDE